MGDLRREQEETRKDKNTPTRHREEGKGRKVGECSPFPPVRAGQETIGKLQANLVRATLRGCIWMARWTSQPV